MGQPLGSRREDGSSETLRVGISVGRNAVRDSACIVERENLEDESPPDTAIGQPHSTHSDVNGQKLELQRRLRFERLRSARRRNRRRSLSIGPGLDLLDRAYVLDPTQHAFTIYVQGRYAGWHRFEYAQIDHARAGVSAYDVEERRPALRAIVLSSARTDFVRGDMLVAINGQRLVRNDDIGRERGAVHPPAHVAVTIDDAPSVGLCRESDGTATARADKPRHRVDSLMRFRTRRLSGKHRESPRSIDCVHR